MVLERETRNIPVRLGIFAAHCQNILPQKERAPPPFPRSSHPPSQIVPGREAHAYRRIDNSFRPGLLVPSISGTWKNIIADCFQTAVFDHSGIDPERCNTIGLKRPSIS